LAIGREYDMCGWQSERDEWKVQKEELCLANIPPSVQMTDLCGELVQWVGVYGVDGKGVVSVNGSETGRDWVLAGFLVSFEYRPECIA
jgi:hypothetical protein